MSRMELEDMPRPFENALRYLLENYMDDVGQAGVCVYGALGALLRRGNTNPTYEEVAKAAGCKEWTLRNTLDKLASLNIIAKVTRVDRKGGKLSNLYKLNDPDSWMTPLVNFTDSEAPSVNFTNGVDGVEDGVEDGVDTRVSEVKETPLVNFIDTPLVKFTDLSSSSFLLDLNTTETNKILGDPAREEMPKTPEPKLAPTVNNDAPFQKILYTWRKNCGQPNAATEDALFDFYVKYGNEIMTEGLNRALFDNERGKKPGMNFLQAILTKLDETARADEARRKALEYRANPQMRPENADVVFADKGTRLGRVFDKYKANLGEQKEDENNGNG